MKPAAGTRLFFIGSEGVLFSAPRQELHAFNTAACVIWCQLEEGLSPPAIARFLAGGGGIDEIAARSHVDAALADWAAKGLLADAPAVPMATPPDDPAPKLPALSATGSATGFAACRGYRVMGVTVRIRYGSAADARRADPLFAHLPKASGLAPDLTVDIVPVPDRIGCYVDGVAEAVCASSDEVAPMVKGAVWTAVLRRQSYLLHFHAGVVGGPDGCVLLPAAAGSGKSTLTLALVHAGFDLFSDEVALLGPDLMVSPFPTAICVKDSGIDAVAGMFPGVRDLPLHLRGDRKRVAYLTPPVGSIPPETERRPVSGIVFPRYRAGAAMTARRLGPAEALARLLGHCLNVGGRLDEAAIAALVGWIGPLPCLEVEYGSLAPVCETIGALLRGGPRDAGGPDET